MGDIRFVDDRVELDGPVVSKGQIRADGGLVNTSGEVKSVGGLAGYSFTDRVGGNLFTPDLSYRFVWYANQKVARLWSGDDLLKVSWGNEAQRSATVEITNGTLKCAHLQLGTTDVGDVITALTNRIHQLEVKLGIASDPVIGQPVTPAPGRPVSPGRPKSPFGR